MRFLPWIVIVAAVACASGSGSDPSSEPPASDAGEIEPGEPFRLTVGEEMRLPSEDLTVRFVQIAADSRCPKDVTCFWAGDAEAELLLTRGADEAAISVHTHGGKDHPREASGMGCTVRLDSVEPYPHSKSKIAPEDYVVTLTVTAGESPDDDSSSSPSS